MRLVVSDWWQSVNHEIGALMFPKDIPLPKTNIFAPEKWCLGNYFPFEKPYFQGAKMVSFREGKIFAKNLGGKHGTYFFFVRINFRHVKFFHPI